MLRALRRLVILLVSVVGGTAGVSAAIAVMTGGELWRTLSVGFLIVGGLMIVSVLFASDAASAGWSSWETGQPSRNQTVGAMLALGALLLALGLLTDAQRDRSHNGPSTPTAKVRHATV